MKNFLLIYICIYFVMFFNSNLASAQVSTIGLISHTSESEDDGYVLFAPFTSDTTYLIDKCGHLVHKWGSAYTPGLDVYLLEDGTLLRSGHYPNSVFDPSNASDGGIIERYDWNGNLLWHYLISDSLETQNHDICYMPNGHILVAIWEVIPASVAIASGRNPSLIGTSLWSAKVIEIVPVGTDSATIVWTWRLWDHMVQDYDSTKPNYGIVANHPELMNLNYINIAATSPTSPDWTHFNAVTYNPQLDQVMISLHNMDEIYIIDHSTDSAHAASHTGGVHNKGGDFLYRWGNPITYQRGTAVNTKLFQQHDPEWLTLGKYKNQIMIFNNGLGRPSGNASSVDIINQPVDSFGNYSLNADSTYGPDTLTWTYQDPVVPGNFFSPYMGGAQILPNGNTLICEAMEGNFFEIDSAKNTVWNYINPIQDGAPLVQGQIVTYYQTAAYRCTFYQSSYAGFSNYTIAPGILPLEKNPYPYTCALNTTGVVPLMKANNSLSIFPNPANTSITINTENMVTVTMSDMTGRVILSAKYNNEKTGTLNISSIPDGIYVICINGQQYQKIVVSH